MNNINKFLEFLGFVLRKLFLVCLFVLTAAVPAAAEPITKVSNEIIPQYHEFARADGKGWLATGETIGTQATDYTVKIYERDTGTEKTTDMITSVAVTDGNATRSKVNYRIQAGTDGKTYILKITIKTSAGNTFEDWVYLAVK